MTAYRLSMRCVHASSSSVRMMTPPPHHPTGAGAYATPCAQAWSPRRSPATTPATHTPTC